VERVLKPYEAMKIEDNGDVWRPRLQPKREDRPA
jgi:hypothetical protein